MKKIFVIALAALMTAMSANAQFYEGPKQKKEKPSANPEDFNPSWFVNFQGGIQLPNTPGMGHLISPVFSVNVGRNIIPLATGRISLEGCNSKVYDAYSGAKKTFKYVTASADAMLNLSNCIAYRERPINFYFIAGVGANWSAMPTTNSSKFSPNVRLGGMAVWRADRNLSLNLEEGEVDCGDEQKECYEVVPVQVLVLEKDGHQDGEHSERDNLLNDLELHETEGTSVFGIANAVGRYHEHILKQSDAPREENDSNQWPVCADALGL